MAAGLQDSTERSELLMAASLARPNLWMAFAYLKGLHKKDGKRSPEIVQRSLYSFGSCYNLLPPT